MSLEKHLTRAKKLSDAELHRDIGAYIAGADIHVAARTELNRREDRRTFWQKDVVAWAALAISIFSLIISINQST